MVVTGEGSAAVAEAEVRIGRASKRTERRTVFEMELWQLRIRNHSEITDKGRILSLSSKPEASIDLSQLKGPEIAAGWIK
jgi:hypothetical protein